MSGLSHGVTSVWGKSFNLPDKEFRYLRHACYCGSTRLHEGRESNSGAVISATLLMSP
jgi:hypothetical protein